MIEHELRRALERDELRLHFQPVVRSSSGAMIGAEALVRWQHPTRGLLAPGLFLPAAERAGLMDAVGEWVVSAAIAERATWPDGTFLSLNLSPGELASAPRRDLVGLIGRTCARAGVAPSDVWIEVTEQPITELDATVATLAALRDLGVKLVLDDFGSGCASLARLRRLPFEICKLDRSFVTGLATAGGVAAMRSVLAMLRTFGLEVVAEGVETADEQRLLDELGCDLLQGFHLARPVPADRIAAMLAADRDRVEVDAVDPVSVATTAEHRRRIVIELTSRRAAIDEALARRHRHLVVAGRAHPAHTGAVVDDPIGQVQVLRAALAATAMAKRAQVELQRRYEELRGAEDTPA